MSSPMRYVNGITNVASENVFGQFPQPDPTKVFGYFNDFFQYSATDWVLSTIEAGAGSATEAISDTETGGVLLITNDAADGDHDNFQLSHDGGTNDSESFLFTAGKKAWFKARLKTSDADKVHVFIGLHITNADPVNAAPTDGLYFELTAGVLSCVMRKNAVSSSEILTPTPALADGTFFTVGYHWDGVNTLYVYVNDIEVTTIGSTNLPNDEYLAVSFGVENEEAVAKTLSVDYIGVWMER